MNKRSIYFFKKFGGEFLGMLVRGTRTKAEGEETNLDGMICKFKRVVYKEVAKLRIDFTFRIIDGKIVLDEDGIPLVSNNLEGHKSVLTHSSSLKVDPKDQSNGQLYILGALSDSGKDISISVGKGPISGGITVNTARSDYGLLDFALDIRIGFNSSGQPILSDKILSNQSSFINSKIYENSSYFDLSRVAIQDWKVSYNFSMIQKIK